MPTIFTFKDRLINAFKSVGEGIAELDNAFREENQDTVIFAGLDQEQTSSSKLEFGIYVPLNNVAMWMPATTSDPDVMLQITSMALGQSFKITEEASDGPLGTVINGLEIDHTCQIYPSISKKSEPVIRLG